MNAPRNVFSATLVAVALASPSAFAQTSNAARSPWSASVEIGPAWHVDVSHQTFRAGTTAPPVGGLNFGRDLVHLGSRLTLGAELGWRTESSSGYVRQAFDTRLATQQLQLAVSLRVELTSWFTPYARVAGGASYLDASITDDSNTSLTATAWTPYGSAGAGVLLTGGRWFDGIGLHTLRVALAVEGGYQLAMPATLMASTPAPANERLAADRIATRSVSLGTLDPSAAYLRFSIGFRF